MKTILAAIAALLAGCTVMHEPYETQTVHATTVCIFSMCEGTDRIERIGDPKAEGSDITIEDKEEDNSNIKQGEDGNLAIDSGVI